jgi:rhodanese-related sulfurtransferase
MSVGELDRVSATALRETTAREVRASLVEQREIALLDAREEAFHAEGHPLFAANLPLSRLELDAYARLPRRSVPVVVLDNGEGLAALAAHRLTVLGYTNVSLLQGGLQGWRDAGFELFRDVNAPSKAFGELVETQRHTPSLSAQEVKALIDAGDDIVIVDARRYEEFRTMSIPTATSVPGGELVYRLYELAQRPATRIIVNCAGRTRSIVGTQSLINAGLPNRVTALRNGTIGWSLAEQPLDHGATREAPPPAPAARARAAVAARKVADAAGVRRTWLSEVEEWSRAGDRTVYLFDVRTPAEYFDGHLRSFRSAPGGQLVQETDFFAPVRGARIVLADDEAGVRADMTASWLAQMNWEVYVVDDISADDLRCRHDEAEELAALPAIPADRRISGATLSSWLRPSATKAAGAAVLDFSRSRDYLSGHIPGSWFSLRSRLDEALQSTADSEAYVVTAREQATAKLAWRDLTAATAKPVYLLTGGTDAWQAAGFSLDPSPARFASQPVDYYRRPYEGTDSPASTMQAYLDWEFGLVEQLKRDGTHGFRVLRHRAAR